MGPLKCLRALTAKLWCCCGGGDKGVVHVREAH